MPIPKRERLEPTEAWEQLRLPVGSPASWAGELLRPIVLLGLPPAERAGQTGVAERTLRRRADRFDAYGMAGRSDRECTERRRRHNGGAGGAFRVGGITGWEQTHDTTPKENATDGHRAPTCGRRRRHSRR